MSESSEVLNKLTGVVGLAAWGVTIGHGSFLTLEFGEAVVDPSRAGGRSHGEWHLWIYGADWKLLHSGEVLVTSDDDKDRMGAAVLVLEGLAVESVEVFNDFKTTLQFQGDYRLVMTPESTAEMDDWMLWTPEDMVLTVGPGHRWRYRPADEPVVE